MRYNVMMLFFEKGNKKSPANHTFILNELIHTYIHVYGFGCI